MTLSTVKRGKQIQVLTIREVNCSTVQITLFRLQLNYCTVDSYNQSEDTFQMSKGLH